MTNPKNIVDDYYSNIEPNNTIVEKELGKTKKPLKIKTKTPFKKKTIESEKIEFSKIEPKEEPYKTKEVNKEEPKHTQEKSTDKKEHKFEKKNIAKEVSSSKNTNLKPTNQSSYSAIKSGKKSFPGAKKGGNSFDTKPRKKTLSPYSSKRNRGKISFFDEERDGSFIRSNKINKKKKEEKKIEDIEQNLVDRSGQTVVIPEFLSLKVFSEKIGIPLSRLIAEFMKNGIMVNINSKIDFDSASIIADFFQIKLEKDSSYGIDVRDVLEGNLSKFLVEEDSSKLKKRPPVISIMGHVDHGKTSLLDYIRKSKIVDKEAGGITQSIGAYQVEQNGQKITFLDTPGHEAFTMMRARGARSTDIAVLVIAADEGVKPQTIESINHAKEADIPIIVAINKIDKKGSDLENVKSQLAKQGLNPEDWGGDTPIIPVSAKDGIGIDSLLEMILLVAEIKNLKANPNRMGISTIIESHLDTKLGPVATILINSGTINSGDSIVCRDSYGKVKVMKDYSGKNIKKASIGDPVFIVGLNKVLKGGDILQVVSSLDNARLKAIEYSEISSKKEGFYSSGIELLMSRIKSGNLKHLKILLKADSNGSLEAIKGSLVKLSTPETSINIIHSGVGNITESDVSMCEGSNAILIGFGVSTLATAKNHLISSGIEFINSDIIYRITERVEKIVTGMLDPKEVEIFLGKAEVGAIFYNDKKFMIIGLKISDDNRIESGAQVRVIRSKKIIGKGKIDSLKKGVEEINSLDGPSECGIKFVGDTKVEKKDELEVYKIELN